MAPHPDTERTPPPPPGGSAGGAGAHTPSRPVGPCAGADAPNPPSPARETTAPRRKLSLAATAVLLAFLLAAAIWGVIIGAGVKTIHDLLGENRQLRQAIANLTHEDQIGYAKVLAKEQKN